MYYILHKKTNIISSVVDNCLMLTNDEEHEYIKI